MLYLAYLKLAGAFKNAIKFGGIIFKKLKPTRKL